MAEPTNTELAEALRSIEGLPLGTRLIVRLAADRLCDGGGWIEWGGGEMPVKRGTRIKVRHRDGDEFDCTAGNVGAVRWDHRGSDGDIIAYRTVK